METTTLACGVCGKSYQQERNTRKFCSDACRKKSNRIKKKAMTNSAPAGAVVAESIEQVWVPTKRESILNKVIDDLVSDIWKIKYIANSLERCPVVENIIAITTKSSNVTFRNEVRQEVDDFDINQRMYEWDAFVERTGLVLHTLSPFQ